MAEIQPKAGAIAKQKSTCICSKLTQGFDKPEDRPQGFDKPEADKKAKSNGKKDGLGATWPVCAWRCFGIPRV